MPTTFGNALVIAISSRALFDLEESHAVYVEQGLAAYARYQIERENEPLGRGVAFSMVKKFLALNEGDGGGADDRQKVEIVLISRNSADTGLRIFNSIQHYGLNISRAAFTGGQSPYQYVQPFGRRFVFVRRPARCKSGVGIRRRRRHHSAIAHGDRFFGAVENRLRRRCGAVFR